MRLEERLKRSRPEDQKLCYEGDFPIKRQLPRNMKDITGRRFGRLSYSTGRGTIWTVTRYGCADANAATKPCAREEACTPMRHAAAEP